MSWAIHVTTRVTELRRLSELCAIRREWSALWERCSSATPFSAPEWLLPWTRHLFGGGEIRSIAAWSGGRLVGLAPLFIHGVEKKQVSFLGSGVTDYLDFLIDDEAREPAGSIWCHLRGSAGWDLCELVEVPDKSVVLTLSSGRREAAGVCPVVTLPGSAEALDARLNPKFRHNLRNSLNRVRDLGGRFEIATPDQDPEYLQALFRLHAARWRERNEPGMLASGEIQAFFREMAREFRERGWLRFIGLRRAETLHAVICVFCARGRWFYYLSGFDETLARFGPGNLLIRFAMEQAIREGAREFDFLRNGEPYKYRWGAEDRLNWRVLFRPESSAGHAVEK